MKQELKQLRIEKATIADDEHNEVSNNMTSQEKAKQLVYKYYRWGFDKEGDILTMPQAKECALIAIDECLKSAFFSKDEIYNFYLEVKKEIEKL